MGELLATVPNTGVEAGYIEKGAGSEVSEGGAAGQLNIEITHQPAATAPSRSSDPFASRLPDSPFSDCRQVGRARRLPSTISMLVTRSKLSINRLIRSPA